MIDNLPSEPDEHHALSAPDVLARGGDDAHHIANDQPAPAERPQYSDAQEGGFIALLDASEVPDEVVGGMREWLQAGATHESRAHDQDDQAAAKSELLDTWGDKAPANFEALRGFLMSLPKEEAEIFQHARDPAGRLYGNDAALLVRLTGIARARGASVAGLNTIEGIERYLKTNPAKYRKDEALQARYRELLDARELAKGS